MLTLASSHAAASGRTSVVRLRSCEILGKSNARRQLMRLNSTAFADGAAIPRRFTCDGADLSPPLNVNAPATNPARPALRRAKGPPLPIGVHSTSVDGLSLLSVC